MLIKKYLPLLIPIGLRLNVPIQRQTLSNTIFFNSGLSIAAFLNKRNFLLVISVDWQNPFIESGFVHMMFFNEMLLSYISYISLLAIVVWIIGHLLYDNWFYIKDQWSWDFNFRIRVYELFGRMGLSHVISNGKYWYVPLIGAVEALVETGVTINMFGLGVKRAELLTAEMLANRAARPAVSLQSATPALSIRPMSTQPFNETTILGQIGNKIAPKTIVGSLTFGANLGVAVAAASGDTLFFDKVNENAEAIVSTFLSKDDPDFPLYVDVVTYPLWPATVTGTTVKKLAKVVSNQI